jgi:hypothetical protein
MQELPQRCIKERNIIMRRMRRTLTLAIYISGLLAAVVLWPIHLLASTYTVKSGGGGNYSTIQQCATAMTPGDTCTVYAGTYNENITVPAGTAGNYKTITVNGSDVVSVTGSFTLNSYTKVSGFVLNHTGSCLSLNSSATNVIIGPNNSLTSCSTFTINSGNSFIYYQGNTLAYAECVPPNPGATCGRGINVFGSHVLIENNDFSHYQLAIVYGGLSPINSLIVRNNKFHDQLETEAGSNGHSDSVFSEPQTGVSNVLIEGNSQRNAVGPNAKGFLSQNDSGCAATCTELIIRHNITSRLGSGTITNDKSWPHVVSYNNTVVDNNEDVSTTFAMTDNSNTAPNAAFKNQIYYYTQSSINDFNPYACNNTDCSFGSNLYWCTGTCTNIHAHTYGSGSFLSDSGNKNADPKFVNYVSAGNASNDYHLQAGSPAIAAGTYLTTVASGDSGSGTSLVVNDASYFQDGYGLTNAYSTVSGDCIAVTTVSTHVCVTAINYSTNTLTLAGSITRSPGDSVWLYSKSDGVQVLIGSAPNIGAFGTAGSTPPVAITPSPVAFPNQTVGIPSSPPLTVTVSNTGSATLTLNTPYFTITGINAADFSNTGTGTCTNGGSVLAGNSCTVLLVFTPSVEAVETATLNISGNANGSATINGAGAPTPPTSLTYTVN